MSVISILIIAFFALLLLSGSHYQRPHVVVVQERNVAEGCMGGLINLFLLGMMLFVAWSLIDPFSGNNLPDESDHSKGQKEQVRERVISPEQHLTPDSDYEDDLPDTLINMSPPPHFYTRLSGNSDVKDEPLYRKNERNELTGSGSKQVMVILIKRFSDLESATRLQKHFTRWGMTLFELPADEKRLWACVIIEDEADGKARIREWNRHRADYAHMELELRILQLNL
ncbi:MAG: hypothetical protein R2778_16190 [Saprospiraceae bacterium]